MPRINFVSFTFLFAFGLGSFVGIGLALLAVALARPPDETRVIEGSPAALAPSATPTPTATQVPTATATPVPPPHTSTTLQVHIGPNEEYAILGTLAKGNEVVVEGRDSNGDWVAIEFPPGSSARGWIPRAKVEGLSLTEVVALEVLQASLIDTSPPAPVSTSTPTAFEGNDGVPVTPVDEEEEDVVVPPTRTPRPEPTEPASTEPAPTPAPLEADVTLRSVSAGPSGAIRVVVQNLGPAEVAGVSAEVSAVEVGRERLNSGPLASGSTTVLVTSSLSISGLTQVTVSVELLGRQEDPDTSNNSATLNLSP